jgi:hypothetical protein
MSGNVHSSWGPELTAGSPFPTPSTPGGFGNPDLVIPQKYVRYGYAGGAFAPNGAPTGAPIPSLSRPGNYVWHDLAQSPGGAGVVVEVNPALNGGVGTWTDMDYVNGCTFIDLPEKHGVLFQGSLATGHVWYGYVDNCGHGFGNACGGGTGPNASSFEPRWWIYNPEDCLRVATGHLASNLNPAFQFDPSASIHALQLGCKKGSGGMYFDRETRRLYCAAVSADMSIPGLELPLMHVFQVS